MSLSAENMMKLMAYADGELEGAERRDAELLLARDKDAVTFVEQVAGLGAIVKEGHEDRHAEMFASFDIADAVMAAAEQADREEKPTIASIAAKRAEREAKEKKPTGRLLRIGVPVVAALALAASIFVVVRGHKEEIPMAQNPPDLVMPQPSPTNAANLAQPGAGVAVDSAGKSVSVFYLPTANELSTSVVVWVDESGSGEK